MKIKHKNVSIVGLSAVAARVERGKPGFSAKSSLKHRAAFTLIELLAVMAIMLLLSSLVVGGYFGMVRGSAAVAARDHLFNSLTLARQRAMMDGARTYLMVTGDQEYAIIQSSGIIAEAQDIAGQYLYDRYSDLGLLTGITQPMSLYNMRTGRSYRVTSVGFEGDNRYRFTLSPAPTAGAWQAGDRYGWQVGPTLFLPKGYRFDGLTYPAYVAFDPTGQSSGRTFDLVEEIAAGLPIRIQVDQTGKIQVIRDVGS